MMMMILSINYKVTQRHQLKANKIIRFRCALCLILAISQSYGVSLALRSQCYLPPDTSEHIPPYYAQNICAIPVLTQLVLYSLRLQHLFNVTERNRNKQDTEMKSRERLCLVLIYVYTQY